MSSPNIENDPCPCGSGKKYNECCADGAATTATLLDQAVSQQIQAALQHHQAGRLQQADSIYRQILQAAPNNPDALHLRGLIAYQTGKNQSAVELISKAIHANSSSPMYYNLASVFKALGNLDAAIECYQKALLIKPDYAEALNNLGNAFKDQGKLDAAVDSYRRAVLLNPSNPEVLNNLGTAFKAQGNMGAAIHSFQKALSLKPDYAEAHYNLGNALKDQGRLDTAVASYRKALSIRPNFFDAYGNLGAALKLQGKLDEALACFQQQLSLKPGHVAILHQIASLTGNNTERAPIQYVEKIFDDYAEKFDTHLRKLLKYEIPEKLVTLITQHSMPPMEKWNVLDLGCGTGLAGLAIAQFSRQLVGVDLSANMLKKAKERNLYQRLERLDLLTMMQGEKSSAYDVIIAADVFVYLGRLDEIMREAKRLLCPGGIFAFSVETSGAWSPEDTSLDSQQEYRLEFTGRYAHSASYIIRLAAANGFQAQEMVMTQIRLEQGKPVNGYMALWEN